MCYYSSLYIYWPLCQVKLSTTSNTLAFPFLLAQKTLTIVRNSDTAPVGICSSCLFSNPCKLLELNHKQDIPIPPGVEVGYSILLKPYTLSLKGQYLGRCTASSSS